MLDSIEREHPSAPINDRLLMYDYKVKPCQLHGCKGPDNCLYLHPGEKGRRDPLQSCYDLIPCATYRQNGGSCPDGDRCRRAHGLLELRFHPRAYYYARRLKFEDLEVYLTAAKLLPGERAAIQLILDLKSNGCIRGYELPNDTKGAIYEETSDELARARFASKAIIKQYGYGNALTLNNNGQLSSFSGASCKLPEEDGVALTPIDERVEPPWITDLLSDVDASSPTAGGSIVPNDNLNQGCVDDEPHFILDSGASTHVVGVETTLHNYRLLPEPLSVTVADGYALRVLGIGSIISRCGNFIVPKVHRVEGIQMNLISVGQLDIDYDLSSSFHGGRCEVKKHDIDDRVGGGHVQGDRLYRLSFLHVPET